MTQALSEKEEEEWHLEQVLPRLYAILREHARIRPTSTALEVPAANTILKMRHGCDDGLSEFYLAELEKRKWIQRLPGGVLLVRNKEDRIKPDTGREFRPVRRPESPLSPAPKRVFERVQRSVWKPAPPVRTNQPRSSLPKTLDQIIERLRLLSTRVKGAPHVRGAVPLLALLLRMRTDGVIIALERLAKDGKITPLDGWRMLRIGEPETVPERAQAAEINAPSPPIPAPVMPEVIPDPEPVPEPEREPERVSEPDPPVVQIPEPEAPPIVHRARPHTLVRGTWVSEAELAKRLHRYSYGAVTRTHVRVWLDKYAEHIHRRESPYGRDCRQTLYRLEDIRRLLIKEVQVRISS